MKRPGTITVGTHDGAFHADEVLCYALVTELYADAVVLHRTRSPAVLDLCDIVFDVGGEHDPSRGRYDHHQAGGPLRPDGSAYSSFGLMWAAHGSALVDASTACGMSGAAAAATALDRTFVMRVDASDNGGGSDAPDNFSRLIESFNPPWGSGESAESAFRHAAIFAKEILRRQVASAAAVIAAERSMPPPGMRGPVLVAEENFPARALAEGGHLEGVVFHTFERDDGSWAARGVGGRMAFPAAWRGLSGPALQETTGIGDARYCHAAIPFAVAESRKGIDAMMAMAETS